MSIEKPRIHIKKPERDDSYHLLVWNWEINLNNFLDLKSRSQVTGCPFFRQEFFFALINVTYPIYESSSKGF